MQLGFVGTGTMGNPMARCLIEAGHQVTVHDLRREATTNLSELGARWADSPCAVAKASEVVFTSLPGPTEVEKTVLDLSTGILAGLKPGGAYIDMTTNAPGVFRRIAAECRTRGVGVLDAPVSGRPPSMTIMVGGEAATFSKYRPLLECMGRNIFHVGETGAGCVAKLVTQYLGYSNFVTSIEGLLIAAKAGIDLRVLAQIVPVSAGASRTFDQIPRAVFSGEFTILTLQDFVGAAFGALFFAITQEIWEVSARLAVPNLIAVVLISFFMGFSLIYFSRRRKLLSMRIFHTSFIRAMEIYIISFLTSILLITVFSTAPSFTLMIKQTIVVTLPAVITAATADLLFY